MAGHRLLVAGFVLGTIVLEVLSSHFRGGSISWKWEKGTKVHFYFRLGWKFDTGPGCKPNLIGQFVDAVSNNYWDCQSRNCGREHLHTTNYYCTGASESDMWEQGENNFTYMFPDVGPFIVGFSDADWIKLSNGKGDDFWNISTTVDLRTRSDTGTPNSSPQSLSKPMYYVKFECEIVLKLPFVDPDEDNVRCRWAEGSECISVCNALPGAYLEEETCTLHFNTTSANNYSSNGIYAAAITIEDFPRAPITLGGKTKKTSSDALSVVPLQFLVQIIPRSGPCEEGPRFVPPTPEQKDSIEVAEGNTLTIGLYADNGNNTSAKANAITCSGIMSSSLSPVIPDVNRTNTFTTTLTWKTTHKDLGKHIICANVANDKQQSGEERCFYITVIPKGSLPPCKNNEILISNMGKNRCICRFGFTGHHCESMIGKCLPNVCPLGLYCVESNNTYTCSYPNATTATTTTTTTSTTTDTSTNITTTTKLLTSTVQNYTGICISEYDHCDCTLKPNQNKAKRIGGESRKTRDILSVLFGFPIGLLLGIFTFFAVLRPCRKKKNVLKKRNA